MFIFLFKKIVGQLLVIVDQTKNHRGSHEWRWGYKNIMKITTPLRRVWV